MHICGNIIGDNATNISGINSVTAVKYYGDGSNLTNTGAQMSTPATGEHERVVTNVTSGTMITGFTDSAFKFNLGTNTLTSPNITGNLTGNVTGNCIKGNLCGRCCQSSCI